MGYIDAPEPADSVVLVEATDSTPAFTWGDHRQMRKWLRELEDENPAVAASRKKLEETLIAAGWSKDGQARQICEFCWKTVDEPHDIECPDSNDPSLWVKREALSYQYLSDKFEVVHTSSVPMNDEEGIAYLPIVQLMFPADPDLHVKYVMKKGLGETKHTLMRWEFDKEAWKVVPLRVTVPQ